MITTTKKIQNKDNWKFQCFFGKWTTGRYFREWDCIKSEKYFSILRQGVNFINILRARFSYEILVPKITNLCFGIETFWRQKIVYKKRVCKTLMKLTAGVNFINILCSPFVPIFLCKKNAKSRHNKRKAAQITFVQKNGA